MVRSMNMPDDDATPRPRVGEGCAAGSLSCGFYGFAFSLLQTYLWPPAPAVDDITLGGLCCIGPLFAVVGGVIGAIGARLQSARRGAIFGGLLTTLPLLLYLVVCVVVAPQGALSVAIRLSPFTAILALGGILAGALGALAGRPTRRLKGQQERQGQQESKK